MQPLALYGRNFIRLVERGTKLPSNLTGLYEVRYDGNRLDYEATMKLLRSFNAFKSGTTNVDPGGPSAMNVRAAAVVQLAASGGAWVAVVLAIIVISILVFLGWIFTSSARSRRANASIRSFRSLPPRSGPKSPE